MLLIKVLDRKYLSPIQQGTFYFKPTASFRDDSDSVRRDEMEGRYYIPRNITLNGVDMTSFVESVTFSREYEGMILSISFSMINQDCCHTTDEGLYSLNDSFIKHMRKFGDSFLVFSLEYFLDCVKRDFDSRSCRTAYRPILYYDKGSDAHISTEMVSDLLKEPYGEFFWKDKRKYSLENEWRMIIHDIVNEFQISPDGGAHIQTSFRTESPIFSIDALNTVQIPKEWLL